MRFLVAISLFFGLFTNTALAVPPPDFLFNVGAQLAQVFAIVVIFLSATFTIVYKYLQIYFGAFGKFRQRKSVIWIMIVFILAVSFGLAFYYQQYQQQRAYGNWLQQSVIHQDGGAPLEPKSVTQMTPSVLIQEALPIAISNQEFQKIIDHDPNIYVLDGREDEEYDVGHFPGSRHMRLADVFVGGWQKIPHDRVVYVFCWSGIRGKELADFLRTKNLNARYLQDGANGWVKAGGKWEGGIAFSEKYQAQQYSRILNKTEVESEIAAGTILVDTRPEAHFSHHHIAGSLNIAMIYTPRAMIAAVLEKVPQNKSVITVCDDFVSCFDAKIVGVKLERLGHKFLGRYNQPWEF